MGESSGAARAASNFGRRIFAPKKIRTSDEGISFSELAKFAARRKTVDFLCERTGCDRSTAKRWLSGKSRVSGDALRAVTADIFARVKL